MVDPVKLMRDEQNYVQAVFSAEPSAAERLGRYLDLEERVLFDFYARHVDDDDDVARARDEQAKLRDKLAALDADEHAADEVEQDFGRHVEHVNTDLLASLAKHVDATTFGELGDALEEARQSWDEHEQPPHVRVGAADGEHDVGVAEGASDSPGAFLDDDSLPATPEPNEPA